MRYITEENKRGRKPAATVTDEPGMLRIQVVHIAEGGAYQKGTASKSFRVHDCTVAEVARIIHEALVTAENIEQEVVS